MKIHIVKYSCLKCGNVRPIEMRPDMSERAREVLKEMFDSKLCLSCLTGTYKKIAGTAEVIQAIILN